MTLTRHVLEKLSIDQNRGTFHHIKLAFGAAGHNVADPDLSSNPLRIAVG
jgi:hypothetical protein